MLTFAAKSPFPVTNYWVSPIPDLKLPANYSFNNNKKKKAPIVLNAAADSSDYQLVSAVKTEHNDILIVETPTSRMLLLDSTHNVHSILNKDDQLWTASYWDEFASLPAIVPKGPIAILGLGGGTAVHLMLHSWPSLQLQGFEIDPILIDKARQHFGLSDLEKPNAAGGILNIHIQDALSSESDDSATYAGIIVDLFAEGKVLPQLEEVSTWLKLKDRLMSGGRFMVNCGGIQEMSSYSMPHPTSVDDNNWVKNSTLKALSEAFPGQVSWKRLPETQGANYVALTGAFPDLASWSSDLPTPLSQSVMDWKPCVTKQC